MDGRQLSGSVALVTGGSSGIGRAIATRFGAEGASIVVADVDAEGGKETVSMVEAESGDAAFVETDVTDETDVESVVDAVVERYGRLDVLVNNAGGSGGDGALHRIDAEEWSDMLRLNLTSHFLCSQAALPHMVASDGGSMIHVSSVNGLLGIGLTGYSAAKSGLFGFSRVVAAQYGRYGVRSNVICPGTIQSASLARKREREWDEALQEQWFDQYPLGRFGRPEEVADAALFQRPTGRAT
ncbi:SDR family NAD(P)-dependent oxidoreductase [Haladaptatus pallidirubidus]|uniref:SDR family NAD(P)-dependent oxidoreductase n=1 Tax=Haladaptatus pallidirubidus TaxID=1008152 RepID=UPI0035EE80F6